MIEALISFAFYGFLLKLAIGLVGQARPSMNSFGRAFIVAALLSITGTALSTLHLPFHGLLAVILWLFIVRTAYEIGWGRAAIVAVALALLKVVLTVFVLVPLGLVAVAATGFGALLGV